MASFTSLRWSMTHYVLLLLWHAFVLSKGKGNMGQKETPEETSQIKETRHSNMSISVLMYTNFNQIVVSSEIQRWSWQCRWTQNNTCCESCIAEDGGNQSLLERINCGRWKCNVKRKIIQPNSFHSQPNPHVTCSDNECYNDVISNVNYCLYLKKRIKIQAFIPASNFCMCLLCACVYRYKHVRTHYVCTLICKYPKHT